MSLFSFCEKCKCFFSQIFVLGYSSFLVHCNFRKEKKKKQYGTWKPNSSHLVTKLWLFQLSLVMFRLLKNCEVMINRIFELTIILIVY